MRIICLVFFAFIIAFPSTSQNKYSRSMVLEDLKYLRKSLVESHYNLFAFTSEHSFNENFDNIKSSITDDSLSNIKAISIFQSVISKANNGHTEISFPGKTYSEYAYSGGTLFPLEIAFESHKPLVRKNWSSEAEIKIGSEIISINGQPIAQVLEKIYQLISAERRYFKHAKIELYSFPRLYWQAFGQVDIFVVEFKDGDKTKSFSLRAIDVIEGYEMKREDISTPDRFIKFYNKSAYLKTGNFGGDLDKYKNFIDSSFIVINNGVTQNLIIDLRNNLGGGNDFSDYLISYIADKPFYWNAEFSLKSSEILKEQVKSIYDTTEHFWQSVLNHQNGEIYSYEFEAYQPQGKNNRFEGNVFVLINRQSYSQAAVTAAQIQDYGFATLVGEETAEFPSLYASQFGFLLPNTKIEVKVAKGYIVRVNGSKIAEGVIPDIYINDYLLDEEDEILNKLLIQIEKTNKEY